MLMQRAKSPDNAKKYSKGTTREESTVLNTFAVCGPQKALAVFELPQRWLFNVLDQRFVFYLCSKNASGMEKCVLGGIC